MYVCMQIDTISGSFKPIGIFTEKEFGEKTLKELNKDLRFVCYLSDDIPIVAKNVEEKRDQIAVQKKT